MSGVLGPTRDLGPAIIVWGGTDLGATMGGVTFRFQEEDKPVVEDQEGTASVDDINVGYRCEAEVPLTRMALTTLNALIAGASGSGTSTNGMTVKQTVGISRLERAQELILKPVLKNGQADPDTKKWLHIYKASPQFMGEMKYDNDSQRTYKFMFKGYVDRTTGGVPARRIWGIHS